MTGAVARTGLIAATFAHAEALSLIHAASFPRPETWDATSFAAQLGLPGVFGLIHPDGGLVLARTVADEAEILTLAVMPEARRAGLGRRLLRSAIAEAAERGAASLFLEVAATNDAALLLYRSDGFREIGRRREYYAGGGDALVMQRDLKRPGAIVFD